MADHGIDLSKLTAEQLTKLIADAEDARRGKVDEARAALIEEVTGRARALGLEARDLFGAAPAAPRGRKPRSDAGSTAAVKYRSPNGETWTGRGRRPKWIAEAEARGEKLDTFKV